MRLGTKNENKRFFELFLILLVSCTQQTPQIQNQNNVRNAKILKNGDTSGIETKDAWKKTIDFLNKHLKDG